ncbi:MAG: hypothetical protein ACF8R7_02070 [Phycisphaerales bacterium JB039]
MTRIRTWTAAIGLMLALAAARGQGPEAEAAAARMADMMRARELAMAVHMYTQEHEGLPPDLGSLVRYFGEASGADIREIAGHFVSTVDQSPPVEGDIRAWVNEHASFGYLGMQGVALEDVSDWDRTVIAHLKLDLGHAPGDGGALMVPVTFLDGHVEILDRDEAARLIEESRQTFVALATGGRLPDARQETWNLRLIGRGVRAYAEAHEGALPPDLGAVLEYIPDARGAMSPQEKARVFLSARAARQTAIPEAPTAEWVRQHGSYEYLGAAGVALGALEDPQRTVLTHGRLNDPIEVVARSGEAQRLTPIGTVAGDAANLERDFAGWRIEQSRQIIEFARSGGKTPLPDVQHAMRDLRLLRAAMGQYAALGDGSLPARLSDLYDLIEDPHLDLGPQERAAVFLSPRVERLVAIPEAPEAAWLDERASYVYLGAGRSLRELGAAGAPVLLHQPIQEPLVTRTEGGEVAVAPWVDANGRVFPHPADGLAEWVEQSWSHVAAPVR